MTYALYLLIFLGSAIAVLVALTVRDHARHPGFMPYVVLLGHILVAVAYTTPWDNYLVASGVWWYDPARVIGLTFGWVPVEEYSFFALQTLMTGLWLIWLRRRLELPSQERRALGCAPESRQRRRGIVTRLTWRWRPWKPGLLVALSAGAIWAAALLVLFTGWAPGTYVALEVGWFLPPIILQLVVGADLLWRERRLVLLALLPPIAYLVASDAIAIGQGVWTISPQHSVGILLGNVLPIEEVLFFALTNVVIAFGMTLVLAVCEQEGRTQPALSLH